MSHRHFWKLSGGQKGKSSIHYFAIPYLNIGKTKSDDVTCDAVCPSCYFVSISICLNWPNTSWCLYAHRVPAGT